MKHCSTSMVNISLVDECEVEDQRSLLPPPRTLSPQRRLDRTRAVATTPLYNGHPCPRASPCPPRRSDKVRCKEKKRQSGPRKERKAQNSGGKPWAFTDAAQCGPPFSGAGRPLVRLSPELSRSLPEIVVTGRDDEPSGPGGDAGRVRGLLPGAPRPSGPKPAAEPKDDRYWKTHSIGWRLLRRRALFLRRQRLNDCALAVGLFGVVMMVTETELSWSIYSKSSVYSLTLKSIISASTVILLGLIVAYHCCEVQLYVHDSGAEDWRIAVTTERLALVALELAAAAVHPYPVGLLAYFRRQTAAPAALSETELEIVLALPMFLRLYLLGRAMMLHSRLFTDTASRSIGALNKIHFNARFVGKTLMTTYPGTVLMIFSVSLWIVAAWGLHVCERHHNYRDLSSNYMEALWMVSVTFLSIGYGDVVPHTYCGRSICLLTGIMGAGCTVLVVAVVARKLELTRAEKHVHNFMIDSHISKRMKIAAANVLRETWFIYKHTKLSREKDHTMVRVHQRKLLLAIHQLRRVKMDKRILADQGSTLVDLCKLQTTLSDVLAEVQGCRAELDAHVRGLEKHAEELRQGFRGLMPLLTSTLSTQNSSIRHLLREREKKAADGDGRSQDR
ncbi:small conductance calcium-activated potassium channel protein 1-like isoform X3 [Syngnathoides biaculeatus]|uniref:small conductance calcium-activated potassium channel protein 1-like isoform X3 n=1 Tax=Syngnathoides biaculeatus TaxID=300417 RepID=UPI002ADDE5A8|nr:small conductance calcium-activated potassium channel protein 1-like isoform X3 [Syngnathoides biaculeatus]